MSKLARDRKMEDRMLKREAKQFPLEDLNRTCERCGKRHLSAFVWLELDSSTGIYHRPGQVAPERSQGLFVFGAQCAKRQLEGDVVSLTARQVLARMKKGDCPTYGGGYRVQGFFDDGEKAAPGVMRRLERARKVDYPPHSSVYSRWVLRQEEKS